jgi:hypothetical protein
MKVLMTIGAAAALSAGASAQDAVQWRVEDGGNGHWYRLFARVAGRDWNGWRHHATARGGYLATLTSRAESDFVSSQHVFQVVPPDCNGAHALIGAFQESGSAEPSAGWAWVTGEPFVMDALQWGSLEDCCNGSYCEGDGEDASALWCWIGDCESPDMAGKWNDVGKCLDWWGAVIEWSADCNADGIVDYGQILAGELADADGNNIPDCCETSSGCCPGDTNLDGAVDGIDLATVLTRWGQSGAKFPDADCNRDGSIDGSDLAIVLGSWGGCS